MVKSMTGFGRGENSDDFRQFIIEIKSVNHRYNDVIIKMPKHLSYLEENIKKLIKEKVNRGRVEVYIHLTNLEDRGVEVKPDIYLAKSYIKALGELCEECNIEKNLSLKMLSSFPDVLKIEKKDEDEDEIWMCLKPAVEKAINNLYIMRAKEGKELAHDIIDRSNIIEKTVKGIENRASGVVLEYKNKLKNRIEELLEDAYELDETRLANEVAYFADKSNITEEIVRLFSHINQLKKTINADMPVGRKLDFLVQEMNREVNTIGSKVGDLEITNSVVEIKSELEKIREQIQNIE
ncbi:YicC/YloC family endoribonuclease [Clostridiisalibacter paucivorans]|uniref:YicC/YloC family endoribonuclease n=1 Tax=Clostridiisalibacter paucivorans TaxID=408753 RepID=UPI00047D6895|nr:YicC/YloC family endoribonuclease [Clostridiisalibacter paucivorans]